MLLQWMNSRWPHRTRYLGPRIAAREGPIDVECSLFGKKIRDHGSTAIPLLDQFGLPLTDPGRGSSEFMLEPYCHAALPTTGRPKIARPRAIFKSDELRILICHFYLLREKGLTRQRGTVLLVAKYVYLVATIHLGRY